ncbi:MAG: chitobiase/beta-hexosaminidase C-terminal domain-containing protein, partial [Deltaproteobacteria bacterium]|nr:chitobiase/beta-hexosaminidase C-terminal domain-containing protein [Deltaproteobacteria bacterium]
RDVIAKDLWDAQQSAHAQIIDLATGKETATQIGALLLSASLSTAVNAVKGLTMEEMVECLISPLREPSDFLSALEELEKMAWYIHHTPEGRYYFDRQENLTKLLQGLAHDAPQNLVDDLIRHRLQDMFKASRKTCYEDVLPLPILEDVADRVRRGRVLLVVSPDSKIPPEEVQKFFEGLSLKNNLCVLTGDKTAMGSVEKAARQFFAAQKADGRIPEGHPQREDLERKQQNYEQDFNSTILNLFDKVLFPIQRTRKPSQLASKALDMTRDATKPFNGEEQIEKTLTANPLKLYLDVEKEFDAIRDKAQDLLWPENLDEARWSDVVDRYAEQAGMPWLPPKGLDTLKSIACNRGLWEDLGNGYVTKKPKKKRTSVQIIAESGPDDAGQVRLRINPQNAGPAPRIYLAEDEPVSEASTQLKDQVLTTSALRVNFLVCDPSDQYETGDPVTWTNDLVLRNKLSENDGARSVELFVAPKGEIRFTLDGSEPRDGTVYDGPITLGDCEILLRVFAEAEKIETKTEFRFQAKGKRGVQIDDVKPGRLVSRTGRKLDSRSKTFEGLKQAAEKSVHFEGIVLTVGQGNRMIAINVGEIQVDAAFIEALLSKVLEKFTPDTPVTMTFRKAHFSSGHDLKDFAGKLGMELRAEDIEQ